MLTSPDAGFSLVRGAAHWVRMSFEDTALTGAQVQLAWEDGDEPGVVLAPAPPRGAGLAFDGQCRLYHSLPEAGGVERLLWAAQDPLAPVPPHSEPAPLFAPVADPVAGDFSAPAPPPLAAPRGLAVDADDRLFVAEHGGHEVLVIDLWSRRVLRRVSFPGRPLALAARGRDVLVVTEAPAGLWRMQARTAPRPLPLPPGVEQPARVAFAPDGRALLLDRAGTALARMVFANAPHAGRDVPFATDVAFYAPASERDTLGDTVVVVARRPGERFLRYVPSSLGFEEAPSLTARHYDGLGIVRTPDERIAYWTVHGLRYAVSARLRHLRSGRVVGYALDSGEFQTQWGRIFVDACIPRETAVHVHCIASDEPPEEDVLPRLPPVNLPSPSIPHEALTPPLPAAHLVPAATEVQGRLHRRAEGLELPWARRAPDDPFATYEAPSTDVRGRYLWVVFALSGNGRTTPRLRALRAERPGHDLLARLPRVLSREEQAARFLGRTLAPLAGLLADLDARARLRHALIDPRSAPDEALAWLADFLGLALDERWSADVRRRLIEDLTTLFRFRGTVPGLTRFLGIVTGVRPIILEKFRMRGGAVVGEAPARSSRAVLGAGMRVGGQIGTTDETRLGDVTLDDAFATHAHRFVVMLPAVLSEETVAIAGHVLEIHRPAHTLYELCTVAAGMRVGRGLHVGISAVVGRGSGWQPLQVGASALGRGAIVGRPDAGTRPGSGRVGLDARVG